MIEVSQREMFAPKPVVRLVYVDGQSGVINSGKNSKNGDNKKRLASICQIVNQICLSRSIQKGALYFHNLFDSVHDGDIFVVKKGEFF